MRFPGEAVAAVAATSRYIAEDACALIDVDYEVLPSRSSTRSRRWRPEAARSCTTRSTATSCSSAAIDFGDVEADFARADHVIRRTARWHRMGAQPMETAGTVASWDPFAQSMTLWSNTNFYNFLPWTFANMLRVPSNRLKVIPCTVGGSFGSKHLINKVDRDRRGADEGDRTPGEVHGGPVRQPRGQRQRRPRPALRRRARRLRRRRVPLASSSKIIDDYGAYFQFAHGQHGNALSQPTGPYRIGSLRYEISCVLTNKVQQGFFRGAGADPGNFILERLVDAAADELGIERRRDPAAELHPARAVPVQGPDRQHVRQRQLRGRARPRAGARRPQRTGRPSRRRLRAEGRYIGIGLASCQERIGYNASEWWFLYDNPPLPATQHARRA